MFGIGCVLSPHAQESEKEIRLGMIGLDTSHVIAFTQLLNDKTNPDHVPGAKVIAAFKGGSPDNETSASRIEEYTKQMVETYKVELVDSIEELCKKVDGILIESVDGRPHLEQAKPVIAAGLPFYVDKPVTASLADALELARLAKKAGVPWFGGSCLRWGPEMRKAINPEVVGEIVGCDAYSPISYEEHHPDLFWYGVHGVETLYTAMGRGCKTVSRTTTEQGDYVVGVWDDGRIGTFRGLKTGLHNYGTTIFGTKQIVSFSEVTYVGLVQEIVKFFQTKQPPIDPMETVELTAFMEAADTSKKQGGVPVPIPDLSLE